MFKTIKILSTFMIFGTSTLALAAGTGAHPLPHATNSIYEGRFLTGMFDEITAAGYRKVCENAPALKRLANINIRDGKIFAYSTVSIDAGPGTIDQACYMESLEVVGIIPANDKSKTGVIQLKITKAPLFFALDYLYNIDTHEFETVDNYYDDLDLFTKYWERIYGKPVVENKIIPSQVYSLEIVDDSGSALAHRYVTPKLSEKPYLFGIREGGCVVGETTIDNWETRFLNWKVITANERKRSDRIWPARMPITTLAEVLEGFTKQSAIEKERAKHCTDKDLDMVSNELSRLSKVINSIYQDIQIKFELKKKLFAQANELLGQPDNPANKKLLEEVRHDIESGRIVLERLNSEMIKNSNEMQELYRRMYL